jgi:hypothetical protein
VFLRKHLSSGFRINKLQLVEFDITVTGKQLTGSAKWENILKLYEDRCIMYCLLFKVTERHVKPCTQSATKVSLSVPIISSTVAAATNTLCHSKDNCTVSLNDM